MADIKLTLFGKMMALDDGNGKLNIKIDKICMHN